MHISTQAVQTGLEWDTRTGSVAVPIYQTATFRHPGLGQSTGYDYSRSGNPTRQTLEDGIEHAALTIDAGLTAELLGRLRAERGAAEAAAALSRERGASS